MKRVCWISAGVSSFIAAYLAKPDESIYIDIDDQHPDSIRFINDCEERLDQEIKTLRSPYGSVENVIRSVRYINGIAGAPCTNILKRRVRKEWEAKQTEPLIYVWGMDCSERDRAENLIVSMPEVKHEFPLIVNNVSKVDAHGMCKKLGIKRPVMYDLGYNNNNCIACVKGGMGYYNKIRVDFPEAFKARARLEREIGHSCINGVFLDELDPKAGRMSKEILPDCGIFCEFAYRENKANAK